MSEELAQAPPLTGQALVGRIVRGVKITADEVTITMDDSIVFIIASDRPEDAGVQASLEFDVVIPAHTERQKRAVAIDPKEDNE